MRTTNNGETWQLCKLDAGGGPKTRLPIDNMHTLLLERKMINLA